MCKDTTQPDILKKLVHHGNITCSFVERPAQMKIDDRHSDTSPQKVNEEHLSKILTRLNWPRRLNNDALRVAYYSRQGCDPDFNDKLLYR